MEETLGGRPCKITKSGGKTKIEFLPINPKLDKTKKNPPTVFTINLSDNDVKKLKKILS